MYTNVTNKESKVMLIMMMMTACRQIPTMTKTHHGGNLSVIKLVNLGANPIDGCQKIGLTFELLFVRSDRSSYSDDVLGLIWQATL